MNKHSLYPEVVIDDQFQNPEKTFRAAPFWAWNCRLEQDALDEQLDAFEQMGFGGFHIHSRIGLDTPYLGSEFLTLVKHCNERGKAKGMRTFLYDEDKWPSGYGAGWVTKERKYRSRYLLLSPQNHPDGVFDRHLASSSRISRNGDITYLRSFCVTLDEEGFLSDYATASRDDGNWHLYLVVTGNTPWFNNQSYVDVLNKEAITRFTQVCHDVYADSLGSEFGKSIPSIFSDEPQFFREENISSSLSDKEVGLPYSQSVDDVFMHLAGCSLLCVIPEIVWNGKEGYPVFRHHYHEALSSSFSQSFAKTLDNWCSSHDLFNTGHLMAEATLDMQSRHVGDALRAYQYYQIPGIDMLANRLEYNTAKQAQSAKRQWGKEGILCEIYGVTNWDFDFRGHKLQGDWLAALGVTLRVPHLAWASMAGESKRDYPSPIDQHTTWYKEYPAIEDHFSRLNLALTQGVSITHIGVIHPIEDYWALIGPDDKTAEKRKEADERFAELTQWLIFSQLDFDFISEAQIPDLYDGNKGFGKCSYDVILVPCMDNIRATTLGMLHRFASQGKVIFLGQYPAFVDCRRSDDARGVPSNLCAFEKYAIRRSLAPWREIEVLDSSFLPREDLIYQLRKVGNDRFLFIAHGQKRDRMEKRNVRETKSDVITIVIHGTWMITEYETMSGDIIPLHAEYHTDRTLCNISFYEHDSLLLKLESGHSLVSVPAKDGRPVVTEVLSRSSDYALAEPNALLLDMAEYQLDGGSWIKKDEMLRVDDAIRGKLGMPLRNEAYPQPWLFPPDKVLDHVVGLRFTFSSEIAIPVTLATEMADATIFLNGVAIKAKSNGYYVDRAIKTFPLGLLEKGQNTLVLLVPFGSKTNLEWCYLLGTFGVRVIGSTARITALPEKLFFGDIAQQCLAFYGGSLTYSIQVEAPSGDWFLTVPSYVGALVKVSVDGVPKGQIIGEPYTLGLGHLAGVHTIAITVFGTRYNTFGQIHNTDKFEAYWGPKTWRTKGSCWSYSYQLKSAGILIEPELSVYCD